jgi:DNA-binding transcriptional regulator YiaG
MTDNFKKMNFSKAKSGHLVVSFGRSEKEFVHRVIYETFVGKIKDGAFIRHLNDIKTDNRVSNLAQGNQKENMADALRNGVLKTKLNFEEVTKIRKLKGYLKRKEVATQFGVSESTIKNIWNNHTWRAV